MSRWKVTFENVLAKGTGSPFWKQSTKVEAETYDQAIVKVKKKYEPPKFKNYVAIRLP